MTRPNTNVFYKASVIFLDGQFVSLHLYKIGRHFVRKVSVIFLSQLLYHFKKVTPSSVPNLAIPIFWHCALLCMCTYLQKWQIKEYLPTGSLGTQITGFCRRTSTFSWVRWASTQYPSQDQDQSYLSKLQQVRTSDKRHTLGLGQRERVKDECWVDWFHTSDNIFILFGGWRSDCWGSEGKARYKIHLLSD